MVASGREDHVRSSFKINLTMICFFFFLFWYFPLLSVFVSDLTAVLSWETFWLTLFRRMHARKRDRIDSRYSL